MADRSPIEWTDATWSPIRARNKATGKIGWHCEHASPGCANCYSETFNRDRLGTRLPFKPGHRDDVEIFLDEKMLLQPLRWRDPRKIFVCSMTDLFGDFVPDEMINSVFAVMALAPQHTFQVLTKRSARARAYLSYPMVQARIAMAMARITAKRTIAEMARGRDIVMRMQEGTGWPLPNVWFGVSAEDQRRADERVPDLLATPAAVRFVSAEPLLGPLDIRWALSSPIKIAAGFLERGHFAPGLETLRALNWIIVGGESSRSARVWPGFEDAARSIQRQCSAAGVAFFMKQMAGVSKRAMPPIPADLAVRQMPEVRP